MLFEIKTFVTILCKQYIIFLSIFIFIFQSNENLSSHKLNGYLKLINFKLKKKKIKRDTEEMNKFYEVLRI